MNRPVRPVRVLDAKAIFDWRSDGVLYVKSPYPLGSYAVKLTERLEYWAEHAPDRMFLAQRNAAGKWRSLTYAQALHDVRALCQALLHRGLNSETPVVILSGNSIEHALLMLACMYAGVVSASLSPAYSLASNRTGTLESLIHSVKPAIVFADDGPLYEKAMVGLISEHCELVTLTPPDRLHATPFQELLNARPLDVDAAHARVTADTVARVLFTSGSTGSPKGVITTQRMLCSNQQMLRSMMGFLADDPPVLCDWLPWNHVFGGSHNFGIVLYNGGTLYIDEGKPLPGLFDQTLENLRDVAPTVSFNVPKAYQMLVPALRSDAKLRANFFSRLKLLFYAAAGLSQRTLDEIQDLAFETCGEEILMMSGLGATETAPYALSTGAAGARAGHVGLPVPDVELKAVPDGDRFEVRLRGPNITPGYWCAPDMTSSSFDEEGYLKLGDTVSFIDPVHPLNGFQFEGRLGDDFKLSTGTWVSVGSLRDKFLSHFQNVAQEVVFTAPDRDYVGALIFPFPEVTREMVAERLSSFAAEADGISTRIQRAIMMDRPLSTDAGEMTAKGTVNYRVVLKVRAELVDELYASSPRVIQLTMGLQNQASE